jgi:uncharacterized protein with GYD domain
VAVAETSNHETFTAIMLRVGSLGSIRTSSLRAFDRTEIERIVAKAG